MASTSVPAASAAVRTPSSSSSPSPLCPNRPGRISFPLSTVSAGKVCRLDGRHHSIVTKAKLNEIIGNDAAPAVSKKDDKKEKETDLAAPDMSPEAITEFMAQVASLVKLVDSKDVVELQLKQPGCELIIRKKEALPQPPPQAPVMMMPSHAPVVAPPTYSPPPFASVPAAQAPSSAPPTSSPPAAKPQPAKSSHPPLKSPMAGTFYRSPAPGQPPFVKVGDKVKKGQVLCIIEAMKLMNDIEADHPGTVVEILAEDAKPVGIEQPLFVIEP